MAGEGTPWEWKEFWFRGTEFVDLQKFLLRLRRERIADGLERRQGLTVMDLSLGLTGPESTFPEAVLEILESQTRTPRIPTSG